MISKIDFTNFNPEVNLREYIATLYDINKKRMSYVDDLKLSFTKIDNQGYVVNLSGALESKRIKSWWTGLSLYYCTEKIFEDFFKKVIMEKGVLTRENYTHKSSCLLYTSPSPRDS